MNYLESKEQARAEFIELVRQRSALAPLADSQLMQAMNAFQNLAVEAAIRKVERTRQELYLTTAVNRSSVLALAEDRLYNPRKPSPSRGRVVIQNKSDSDHGLPEFMTLVDERQVPYTLPEPVTITAGETVEVDSLQIISESLEFIVEDEKPLYEILLPRDLSPRVSEFSVFVDSGDGWEEWEYRAMFRNASEEDTIYDEFYSASERIGIRFGNGLFGRIPPKNAPVMVLMWITEGETTLMPGQQLLPLESIPSGLAFESATTFTGGKDVEGTEDIARNAQYNILFDNSIVWDEDYEFFARRMHPTLLWFKVWGEQEQEEMSGGFDPSFINSIFFSCYAPNDPEISSKVKESLDQTPRLNRKYTIVDPDMQPFIIAISGRLKRSVSLPAARLAIGDTLHKNYGQTSRSRKNACLVRDLYELMNRLDIFASEDDIHILTEGVTDPEKLYQMVFIDLDTSMDMLELYY